MEQIHQPFDTHAVNKLNILWVCQSQTNYEMKIVRDMNTAI